MRRRAEEWLEYADVDLRSSEKLGDDGNLTRAAAFHAHQCVEKSIKAIRVELSTEIGRLATDTLASIGQVDRTESVVALYLPELSPDGMGLILHRVRQAPTWTVEAADRGWGACYVRSARASWWASP